MTRTMYTWVCVACCRGLWSENTVPPVCPNCMRWMERRGQPVAVVEVRS